MFCLSRFKDQYMAGKGPTAFGMLLAAKAMSEFDRDPCFCEKCGLIQLAMAQCLLDYAGFLPPVAGNDLH